MKKLVLSISLLGSILFANAQDELTIITDRPDQTESAAIVPKGMVQLETGILIENDINATTVKIPNNLFRIGLSDKFELRVMALEYQFTNDGANDLNGISPVAIGGKYRFRDEKGGIPEIALLAHYTIKGGKGTASEMNGGVTDFRFSLAHTLSDRLSVGYNVGGAFDHAENDEFSGLYTLAFGYSLTDKLGIYGELFGDFEDNHSFDGGFTYLLSSTFQLDVTGGVGLTDEALDNYISAGFSVLFGKKN